MVYGKVSWAFLGKPVHTDLGHHGQSGNQMLPHRANVRRMQCLVWLGRSIFGQNNR